MVNKRPENETEERMLRLLKNVYGNDVLSFKLTGSEVVEVMAMAYQTGLDSSKESK